MINSNQFGRNDFVLQLSCCTFSALLMNWCPVALPRSLVIQDPSMIVQFWWADFYFFLCIVCWSIYYVNLDEDLCYCMIWWCVYPFFSYQVCLFFHFWAWVNCICCLAIFKFFQASRYVFIAKASLCIMGNMLVMGLSSFIYNCSIHIMISV